MLEKIIFNMLAFTLFIVIFFRMVKKNDTNYLYLLALQALGITIQFISLIGGFDLPIGIIIIIYIISVLFPIAVLFIEKKGFNFSEVIYISIAKFYEITGKEEESRKILIKLTEKYKDSYHGHKYLAELYVKSKNYETALQEYIRVLNINSKDFEVNYQIGNLLHLTGKNDDAVKVLTEVLKSKPDYYEASCLLGDVLYDQEKFKDAISVYMDALKYRPYDYELFYNLGMTYTRLNDFQSAKEYYEKAAELNTLLYNAKYSLGQIALLYKELEEAEEYFIECVNAEEMEDGAYYYLAYIEMLKGDREKALIYLNLAIEENSEYYEKAKNEIAFRPIMNKVQKPTNEKKKGNKLKKKEKESILHLEKTYELVANLNHNVQKANMQISFNENQKEKE